MGRELGAAQRLPTARPGPRPITCVGSLRTPRGSSWRDRARVEDRLDRLTLVHRRVHGRIWVRRERRSGASLNLRHHYLWGMAVDPGGPETVVVSAASSPWKAHDPRAAESTIYRKTAGEPWREVREGVARCVAGSSPYWRRTRTSPASRAWVSIVAGRGPELGASRPLPNDHYQRPTGLAVVEAD